MHYQGGKSGTGRKIAPILISALRPGGGYVEPFLGAAGVARHVVPAAAESYLFDAMPDLILLWSALAQGWEPPSAVTESEYRSLRGADPSALRAFAGFGCSFGAKWFAGYRDLYPHSDGTTRSFAGEAGRSLDRKWRAMAPGAPQIACLDYRDVEPEPLDLVYCDPPYAGVTGYAGAGTFDSMEFWGVALEWADSGARVFVSEHCAPEGWMRVWARPRTARMRGAGTQTDGLYTTPGVALELDLGEVFV